jgi:formate hydrogenlyase subunit 4
MVSYEISIGMLLMPIVLYTGSLNLLDIGLKQSNMGFGFILPFLPLFILFFISSLAETNRPPFDLPEAKINLGFIKDHYMLKHIKKFIIIIQSARNLFRFLQRIYVIKINNLKIKSNIKKIKIHYFIYIIVFLISFQFTNINNYEILFSLLPFIGLPKPIKMYNDLSKFSSEIVIIVVLFDKSGIYGF